MSLLYQQNKTPPLPEAACAWGMRTTKLPGSNLIQTPFLVRKIKQDLSPVANWNFNHTFSWTASWKATAENVQHTFLVVKNVQHMCDTLLSTHCIRDWGAHPDPVTELLEYRPFLRTGDKYIGICPYSGCAPSARKGGWRQITWATLMHVWCLPHTFALTLQHYFLRPAHTGHNHFPFAAMLSFK